MSRNFRSDVSLLADGSLESLEARCRQLAVSIDLDSSAVDVSEYEDIYMDVIPEIIRYIRLLERNIDRHEAGPVCKHLREVAQFFTNEELEDLQFHCCEISCEVTWDGSARRVYDLEDDFTKNFPKLIHHARLLERRMDQYQDWAAQPKRGVDFITRLQQVEQSTKELKRRIDNLEDVGNSPEISVLWLTV